MHGQGRSAIERFNKSSFSGAAAAGRPLKCNMAASVTSRAELQLADDYRDGSGGRPAGAAAAAERRRLLFYERSSAGATSSSGQHDYLFAGAHQAAEATERERAPSTAGARGLET